MVESIIANCVYAFLCMAVGYLWNKLKYYDSKQQNTDAGLRALLKDRLISIYIEAKEQKHISFGQMDRANMIYKAYHGLGGNGTGTAIIEELRELPKGTDNFEK